jgi:hypothetical protein
MKATRPWITYRTRFLVKAKQLDSPLAFTDSLGRQHSGRKGDYLVESSDGVLRIAPRQIFEDIYVPLLAESRPAESDQAMPRETSRHEPAPRREQTSPENIPAMLSPSSPFARKAPQPYRDRRNLSPGLRSL